MDQNEHLDAWILQEKTKNEREIDECRDRLKKIETELAAPDLDSKVALVGPPGGAPQEYEEWPQSDLLMEDLHILREQELEAEQRIKKLQRFQGIKAEEFNHLNFCIPAIRAHLESFPSSVLKLKYLYWLDRLVETEQLHELPDYSDLFEHVATNSPRWHEVYRGIRARLREQLTVDIRYCERLVQLGSDGVVPQVLNDRMLITGSQNEFVAILEAMFESGILERSEVAQIVSHFAYREKDGSNQVFTREKYGSAKQGAINPEQHCTGAHMMKFIQILLDWSYRGAETKIHALGKIVAALYKTA